jgi:hypothetical protein
VLLGQGELAVDQERLALTGDQDGRLVQAGVAGGVDDVRQGGRHGGTAFQVL